MMGLSNLTPETVVGHDTVSADTRTRLHACQVSLQSNAKQKMQSHHDQNIKATDLTKPALGMSLGAEMQL